jgi:arginyl-tRNA synthetase
MSLIHLLQQKIHAALAGLVPDPAPYAAMVKPAQDAKFGDYQANCAMSLAKVLGKDKKARDVAAEIVARLDLGDELEPPEIAGPGFINLRFRSAWLAQQLHQMASDERLGVQKASPPQTIVIDFSSPNVAKPMHVGHLRSTIIGDALARLLRFLGHMVVTDNHLGDWGTQFGILLFGYKNYRNKKALEKDPVREMARLYVMVRDIIAPFEKEEEEEDPSSTFTDEGKEVGRIVAEASRKETAKLHIGDEENNSLWKMFMPWCQEEIDRIYRRLDVHFDYTYGESFYNPMLSTVVEDLLAKKIAQPSEGAVIIRFGEDEPPALIRKKDGAFTYTTTDLATIRYRADQWHPDVVLYVVDFRQGLHFKNLFIAAKRWGYDGVDLQHISFGSVLGPDRKPIKTREGGAVELGQLLDEAVERALTVYDQNRQERIDYGEEGLEISAEQKRQVAEVVGIGAVKYADLSQNRESDYIFSWEKMLAMDGNTATYMQYAFARNRSIFRKGNENAERFRTDPPVPTLEHANERALGLQLLRFEDALQAAAAEYRPNLITGYLWDLAKAYSGFFQNCHVLNAETPELRQSRLLLCDLTARVIQQGLDLLGIRTVEQM